MLELGKETSIQFWHRICRKLNIECPSDGAPTSLWSNSYKQSANIKKDVIVIVKHLCKKYPLALLSNTIKEHAVIDRKRNIFEHFDVVLLSHEVGLRKPEKEFFNLASQKLGIALKNLLFIDDDIRWVRAAQKYGLQAILFRSADQLKKEFKNYKISY